MQWAAVTTQRRSIIEPPQLWPQLPICMEIWWGASPNFASLPPIILAPRRTCPFAAKHDVTIRPANKNTIDLLIFLTLFKTIDTVMKNTCKILGFYTKFFSSITLLCWYDAHALDCMRPSGIRTSVLGLVVVKIYRFSGECWYNCDCVISAGDNKICFTTFRQAQGGWPLLHRIAQYRNSYNWLQVCACRQSNRFEDQYGWSDHICPGQHWSSLPQCSNVMRVHFTKIVKGINCQRLGANATTKWQHRSQDNNGQICCGWKWNHVGSWSMASAA